MKSAQEPKSLTILAFLESVKELTLTQIFVKCKENPIFEKLILESGFMNDEVLKRDYFEVRDAYTKGFKDFLLSCYPWREGLSIHFDMKDDFSQFGLHNNPLYIKDVEFSNLFIRLSRANWYAIEFIQSSEDYDEEDTISARVGKVTNLVNKKPHEGLMNNYYESRTPLDYGDVRYHLVVPNIRNPQTLDSSTQPGHINNFMIFTQTSGRFAKLSHCGNLEETRDYCDRAIYDCIKCHLDPHDPLHDKMTREEVFSKLLLDRKFKREWPELDRPDEIFHIVKLFDFHPSEN